MPTTVRIDEDARDKLNELVRHYDKQQMGSVSQRDVINNIVEKEYDKVINNG